MTFAASRRLGAILVDAKVLAEPSLASALDRQRSSGGRLGSVLLEMGLVDDKTIVAALGVQRDLPVADVRRLTPDEDLVALLPEDLARTLSALPVRRTPHGLEVAVGDPLDELALAQLEGAVAEHVVMRLAPADALRSMIDRSYSRPPSAPGSGSPTEPGARATRDPPDEHGHGLLQSIVSDAVRAGASDIHLELRPMGCRVRHRVDGVLTEAARLPPSMGATAAEHAKKLAGTGGRRGFPGSPFTMTVDGRAHRVLVTASNTVQGERVRLRLVAEGAADRRHFGQLGMPADIRRSLAARLHEPSGLIVITGRRGSGRTTTAYAALEEMDTPPRSTIMLQRAVPWVLPSVTHIEIGAKRVVAAIAAAADGQVAHVVVLDDLEGTGVSRAAIRMVQRGMLVVMTITAVDAAAATAHFHAEPGSILSGIRHAVLVQRLDRPDQADGEDGRVAAFELFTNDSLPWEA